MMSSCLSLYLHQFQKFFCSARALRALSRERPIAQLRVADVLSGSGAYNALRGGCGRDAPSNLVRVGNALGAIQFQPPLL
jgi:hypothetical protein